jgi:UDP-N-acetyl-D-glucosamine dehydrogenase
MTYKPDVGDIRESPSLDVFQRLESRGAIVSFHDPFVPRLDVSGIVRERTELAPSTIESFDCVVALTAHSQYDWEAIVSSARLVFDTRNATAGVDRILGEVVTL